MLALAQHSSRSKGCIIVSRGLVDAELLDARKGRQGMMKRWIGTLISALVISVALATANGLAQEKNSLSKGTRDIGGATNDMSGSVSTANQSGAPITFLGADGGGNGALNISDSTGERRVALRVGDGGGSLHTYGPGGQESTSLETNDTGGVLWVTSADGTLVGHLGVDADGGAFWLSNNAGIQSRS